MKITFRVIFASVLVMYICYIISYHDGSQITPPRYFFAPSSASLSRENRVNCVFEVQTGTVFQVHNE